MSLFKSDKLDTRKYRELARDYAKLESDHNQLKIDFNKLNEDYVKMVESTHKVLQDNKKLEAKNDELSNFDGLEEFQKDADKSTKIFVDKIKLERDRADKLSKDNDDIVQKFEVEIRGLRHDNTRLSDENDILKQNFDSEHERIGKLEVEVQGMQELKRQNQMLRNENVMLKKKIEDVPEPKPEPELIEGKGADEAEQVMCDVCDRPFDDISKLIAHCYGKKDTEHRELVKTLTQN